MICLFDTVHPNTALLTELGWKVVDQGELKDHTGRRLRG